MLHSAGSHCVGVDFNVLDILYTYNGSTGCLSFLCASCLSKRGHNTLKSNIQVQ